MVVNVDSNKLFLIGRSLCGYQSQACHLYQHRVTELPNGARVRILEFFLTNNSYGHVARAWLSRAA